MNDKEQTLLEVAESTLRVLLQRASGTNVGAPADNLPDLINAVSSARTSLAYDEVQAEFNKVQIEKMRKETNE